MSFTDDNLRDVATFAGVSEEQVRAYLKDDGPRNRALEKAFYRITSMYPIRHVKPRPVSPSSMGGMVPHEICPECKDV